MNWILNSTLPFTSLVHTDVRRHLSEGGWPADADASRSVGGGLLQVGEAGSQPFAQSVTGAGAAAVARPGQFWHWRAARKLCHCTIPAETVSDSKTDMTHKTVVDVKVGTENTIYIVAN